MNDSARRASISNVEILLHPIPTAFANKIGRMSPQGGVIGEYPIGGPNCGARAIIAPPDGRLFFSAHNAGAIGEVIPRR